jgi:hypothetical protein
MLMSQVLDSRYSSFNARPIPQQICQIYMLMYFMDIFVTTRFIS